LPGILSKELQIAKDPRRQRFRLVRDQDDAAPGQARPPFLAAGGIEQRLEGLVHSALVVIELDDLHQRV